LLNLLDCRLVCHLPDPDVFYLFWRKKGKWERKKREEGREKKEGAITFGDRGDRQTVK
jgi:hypothetical protein